MASKLPLEDKLALQEENLILAADYKETLANIAAGVAAEVAEDVIAGNKIDTAAILDVAVEGAKTLLDKYSTKEG